MEKSFEMATAAVCGAGKLSGSGGAEYPCVKRLRHRRLFTFLWLQGFEATANSMLDESDAFFSIPRLQELVYGDRWWDAIRYLSRFLPPPTDTERRPQLSPEAEVLHRFLAVHMALACIVAGRNVSHDWTVCRGAIRLRSIILSIHYARHQVRDSIDWERVRYKAVFIVQDLAYKAPELRDFIYMPGSQVMPHNVLPIGFRFRRRSRSEKQIRRPGAYALAKVYLAQQRRLPVFAVPSQESCDELSVSKALDWVADLVDECLKAGMRIVLPLHTSAEGETAALVSQIMFGSLTRPAFPGIPTVAASEGIKFTSNVPTSSAPFLGTTYAPVANAGAPISPVSETMNLTSHARDSGALVAPVSQNMFGTLTGPAPTAGMPLVANAGHPAVLPLDSGAPYLATMFNAPVLLTAVDCSTGISKNFGLSPMTKNSGAPVSPAKKMITNLANHAENSGTPVAPAVQTTNLGTCGINKGLAQKWFSSSAGSAHKILDASKNLREELSKSNRQLPLLAKQV